MVNVLQAMILTDGSKMELTPTYHVFSLFRPFQDATFLPTDKVRGGVEIALTASRYLPFAVRNRSTVFSA